jgi:hypothetical protein
MNPNGAIAMPDYTNRISLANQRAKIGQKSYVASGNIRVST